MAARAALVEQVLQVPVSVSDAFGKTTEQPITVTVFSDDAASAPRPLLVLNHGRSPKPAERAAMGRARYSAVVSWLVAQGFVVAVPTRVGYGASGGPDIEDSGACDRKNYPPGYRAAAAQTLAVLQALRARPDVLPGRSVVMGQSYGGATAVAVAALNPPGVVAAINFAGGGGGNPETQPQRPCSTPQLERMFREFGREARVPMLWVYTENDQYFGPEYPRAWFAAFREAGGVAEFQQYPPHGDDGHSLFTRFPKVWQPRVAEFLRSQGFEIP
ncbi:dienelactone hydrolase family protein [Aquabacterium sp. OR-4]|uniref:dienelactone hydrolase family protein n=1 Tax=Aquabacterium sp. OR-4 TaxID=2978127 RepID=UPI0021B4B8FF|nr:alpha/beta hydrolase [Aquabacterium sp. OR-4]MDT7837399.1 alpha/beta fold hydrolase [Aquabacterium sp. OR-4]